MNESTIETPVATGGKDKGFTLIELLIVIVILGVLATVTVFAVRGISDKGGDSACAADKNTLETAIESYLAADGRTRRFRTPTTSTPNDGDPATTTDAEATPEAELVRATAPAVRSPGSPPDAERNAR